MAPVVSALRARPEGQGPEPTVETLVVFTGQHTTLVDQVLSAFDLAPDRELGIMKDGQSLYDVVHAGLDGLREVVRELRPDLILVQGDTASVFTASLVGFFEQISVGHVEAGLRSGDKAAPFPEEVLRRLTDVVADLHFAPTRHARDLLLREGVPAGRIHVTGNTVVDALLGVSSQERVVGHPVLRKLIDDPERRLVLLTAHRRESFGDPLRDVFEAIRALVDEVEDIELLYPVHPNPNVVAPARELLSGHPRIHLTDPLDYFDLVAALSHAALVLTDSGGIQEEAPTFGTRVLVLRDVTERPEGIEAGVAELVGTDREVIVARARAALATGTRADGVNPYGDGRAAARIADVVMSTLTGRPRDTTDWDG